MLIKNIIVLLIAYLLGSINTSIIVSKTMIGDDIRNHGSGNAGATNTLRTVGKKGAILVVAGDILKTVIAVMIGKLILDFSPNAVYIAGMGTVLGHNFPLYFKFKGGKGIVVSTTAMFFANPLIGLIVFVAAIAIMATTRYVSLGSVLGAVLFVVLAFIFENQNTDFVVFALMLALLAIYMHKTNIVRLLNGTENKLNFKK